MRTLCTMDELHATDHIIKTKIIFVFSELTLNFMFTTSNNSIIETLKRAKNHKRNFWRNNGSNFTRSFTLKIIRKCLNFNLKTKKFHLYLNETLETVYYSQNNLLHKRTELLTNAISK